MVSIVILEVRYFEADLLVSTFPGLILVRENALLQGGTCLLRPEGEEAYSGHPHS